MDQWIETGRQFVDGVAGTRPGQRRSGKSIGSGLDNVGRWVGDKIDWFFEEEDDWVEPWELEKPSQTQVSSQKRPLGAISLRGRKSLSPSASSNSKIVNEVDREESWPDDSSFRINRWERQQVKENQISRNSLSESPDFKRVSTRPLPRSSRRRN
tara:strand:- start:17259 stop:17723 length:465 start_codon:yes stop_codon:yes gene_type:complete